MSRVVLRDEEVDNFIRPISAIARDSATTSHGRTTWHPVAVLSPPDQAIPDEPVIGCPVCGYDYTHFVGVEMQGGEAGYTVTARMTEDGDLERPEASDGFRSGEGPILSSRRDSVMLLFECEQYCAFGLSFEQHKGHTFARAVSLGWWGEDGKVVKTKPRHAG